MERRLRLNAVVAERATVLQPLVKKDQLLLTARDAFLVLDFGLDGCDRIVAFNIQGDGLARGRLDEYLKLLIVAFLRYLVSN